MISEKVTVITEAGLHFRPASRLSEEALKYDCSVQFKFGDSVGSLKSFLGILAAGIRQNTEIEIICECVDEEAALHNIVQLIKDGLK